MHVLGIKGTMPGFIHYKQCIADQTCESRCNHQGCANIMSLAATAVLTGAIDVHGSGPLNERTWTRTSREATTLAWGSPFTILTLYGTSDNQGLVSVDIRLDWVVARRGNCGTEVASELQGPQLALAVVGEAQALADELPCIEVLNYGGTVDLDSQQQAQTSSWHPISNRRLFEPVQFMAFSLRLPSHGHTRSEAQVASVTFGRQMVGDIADHIFPALPVGGESTSSSSWSSAAPHFNGSTWIPSEASIRQDP
eukprot:3435684-Amphidinium_carterae.1